MVKHKTSYIGFGALQKHIEAKGASANVAGAIAAKVGMEKYGKKKFEAAAHAGKSLRNAKPLKG